MKILVVEDSPEVAMITVEYLSELGHEAVAVADAELAIVEMDRQAFDAVMTDVSLPGISGIDLAKHLLKHFPKLPVIIASGYGSLNLETMLGQEPPNVMVLTKPYDMEMLVKTLAQAQEFVAN
jgi:CheY-like chemotaxis protein